LKDFGIKAAAKAAFLHCAPKIRNPCATQSGTPLLGHKNEADVRAESAAAALSCQCRPVSQAVWSVAASASTRARPACAPSPLLRGITEVSWKSLPKRCGAKRQTRTIKEGRGRLARRARCYGALRRLPGRACLSGVERSDKKLRSPEFVLTHSPRPAVRYRPLPTLLSLPSFFRNSTKLRPLISLR
jgi:hypothetical protein